MQGWKISKDNVNEFLEAVLRQIKFIEDAVSQVSGNIHEQFERDWKNITEVSYAKLILAYGLINDTSNE